MYSAENAKDIHCMAKAPREKLITVRSHAKIEENKRRCKLIFTSTLK